MHATNWPLTSHTLLERLKSRDDQAAWPDFVTMYSPLVYGFARRRGFQHADSCDIAQEVFLNVARSIPQFKYDRARGRFRSWLGTIAIHEIGRYVRRQVAARGGGVVLSPGVDPPPDSLLAAWNESFEAFVWKEALARCRKEFPEEVWQAFDRVWLQDQDSSEVARSLDRRVEWVYKAKFRVLTHFRQEVAHISDEGPA